MAYTLTPEMDFTVLIKEKNVEFPSDCRNLILQGDLNSKRIRFKMHRYHDGVDLAEKKFHIVFENQCGESSSYDIAAKDIHAEEHVIVFDWWINSSFSATDGKMKVMIEIDEIDDSDNIVYRFQTLPFYMFVEKTIVTNEKANPGDYYLDIKFCEENTELKTYPMESDLPSLVIKDRSVIMPDLQDIVVTNDTRSRVIHFEIGRYFDTIDLSKKTICIKYLLPNRTEGDRSLVYNETVTAASIKFDWLIDSKVTQYPGEVQFVIEFIGYDSDSEFYCWSTLPSSITISEGLEVDNFIEQPNPSWIQSWCVLADKYLSDYSKYISEVREKAKEVSDIYDKTVILAQEAKKQAEISENYSIVAFNEAERAKAYSKDMSDMRNELIEKLNKFYEDYVKLELKLQSLELSDLSQSLQDIINGKADKDEVRLIKDSITWCDLSDALKELINSGGSGEIFNIIDDFAPSKEKTYSSSKIEELLENFSGGGAAEEKPGDVYIDFSGEIVSINPENGGTGEGSGGEDNIIEEIQLNGVPLPVTDKIVNIDNIATQDYVNDLLKDYGGGTSPSAIPTKTSELTNDSHFVSDENYVHTDHNFTDDMKSKLDGISEGANKTIVDSEMSSTSDNPVQNKVIKKYIDDNINASLGDIIRVIDTVNRVVV